MKIFDEIENLRREAYVKAVLRDDVIGYIGGNLPVELFHSRGLYSIPVYGIDAEILNFSQEKNLCDFINATITYSKTDKCPLIHSSKLIVLENFCPVMTRELSKLGKVFIYDSDKHGQLITKLNQVYGVRELRDVKNLVHDVAELLHRIKFYSDLSGLNAFILEYYINFLELDEQLRVLQEISSRLAFHDSQINFIPVHIQSGAGIYRQIDKIFAEKQYRIIEDFCAGTLKYKYVFEKCPFHSGEKICYKL